MARIFFDHISTTPLDSRVFEAMKPYFLEYYGNPSSHIHDQGQAALKAVDAARGEVAALVNAAPGEIIFTSGATEANNLAVKGAAEANERRGKHIVASEVEHFSVLNAMLPCATGDTRSRSFLWTSTGRWTRKSYEAPSAPTRRSSR